MDARDEAEPEPEPEAEAIVEDDEEEEAPPVRDCLRRHAAHTQRCRHAGHDLR